MSDEIKWTVNDKSRCSKCGESQCETFITNIKTKKVIKVRACEPMTFNDLPKELRD